MSVNNTGLPGIKPRWVDVPAGTPRRRNGYPFFITDAIDKARDSGVPANEVKKALERLIEKQQAS